MKNMKPKEYMEEIFLGFKKRDAKKLRKLNESIIREASLIYSKKLYYLAVIAYVLSKILGKPRYMKRAYAPQVSNIEKTLKKLSECDENCSDEQFQEYFKGLEKSIKNLEAEDPRFVIDLLSKGKLKVAATLYAQGISLGMASEITGIEKHEILSYAGHTMMFDRVKEEKSVKERMKALKSIIEG